MVRGLNGSSSPAKYFIVVFQNYLGKEGCVGWVAPTPHNLLHCGISKLPGEGGVRGLGGSNSPQPTSLRYFKITASAQQDLIIRWRPRIGEVYKINVFQTSIQHCTHCSVIACNLSISQASVGNDLFQVLVCNAVPGASSSRNLETQLFLMRFRCKSCLFGKLEAYRPFL